MPVKELGFSLLEVFIAMAISSVLLLGAARFLPALQRDSLTSTRKLALEENLAAGIYRCEASPEGGLLSWQLYRRRAGNCRTG